MYWLFPSKSLYHSGWFRVYCSPGFNFPGSSRWLVRKIYSPRLPERQDVSWTGLGVKCLGLSTVEINGVNRVVRLEWRMSKHEPPTVTGA